MATIKNNLNDISEDTQSLVKDYLKLISVKLSENLALVLGILATVFILSILLLLVVVFCTFALATLLNDLLNSEFWGYWIVTAFYVLIIAFLIIQMVRTKTPLLANLFVKFIVFILNVEIGPAKNLNGLRYETENIKQKIETDKIKVKSNIQLLPYTIMDSFFTEIFSLFKSKKKKNRKSKKNDTEDPKPIQENTVVDKDQK